MSKTILRRLFVLALCACLVLLAVLPAGADFGDYSGDSDFGDSSDWSSSDSSWDSSDYDSDYSSESSGEGLGGATLWTILIILVICFAIGNIGSKNKKKAKGGTSWSAAANRKLKPMAEYEQLDENFDKAELTSKLSNLYVQMQDCWQKKDISPIRPYCTDAFFTQMDNQIQRKKQQGQTNYIERIAVLSVELRGWCQEGGNDVLVARASSITRSTTRPASSSPAAETRRSSWSTSGILSARPARRPRRTNPCRPSTARTAVHRSRSTPAPSARTAAVSSPSRSTTSPSTPSAPSLSKREDNAPRQTHSTKKLHRPGRAVEFFEI